MLKYACICSVWFLTVNSEHCGKVSSDTVTHAKPSMLRLIVLQLVLCVQLYSAVLHGSVLTGRLCRPCNSCSLQKFRKSVKI